MAGCGGLVNAAPGPDSIDGWGGMESVGWVMVRLGAGEGPKVGVLPVEEVAAMAAACCVSDCSRSAQYMWVIPVLSVFFFFASSGWAK